MGYIYIYVHRYTHIYIHIYKHRGIYTYIGGANSLGAGGSTRRGLRSRLVVRRGGDPCGTAGRIQYWGPMIGTGRLGEIGRERLVVAVWGLWVSKGPTRKTFERQRAREREKERERVRERETERERERE